ncbi:Rhodanese domain protein [Psychromonas ingrahamii 37]|uniref:Rhodanese domain protein n=1 Tax=Psychromonas ingrahamii (strain DSM 17664 / CCUG 51855 / 37) TaxID=357804 RepID=A1SRE8_PSYIN|nr:rhodanese-like domain-containing protein [Psychromonas ingrahamii]ABM02063.1 Rhodanese domain protein [Psychromonas ingrahamii 37]
MLIDGRELVESLRSQVQEISAAQLHDILHKIPHDGTQAVLIDIREVAEIAAGTIANAVLIPRGVLEMQISSEESLKRRFPTLEMLAEQPVYLLCRSGARSVLSAISLQQMGFKHVYSVAGGFLAWQAAGYECTNKI